MFLLKTREHLAIRDSREPRDNVFAGGSETVFGQDIPHNAACEELAVDKNPVTIEDD
jgi:hypothetical protein